MAEIKQPKTANKVGAYREWLKAEGIPVIESHYVSSLHTVELGPWKRRGGLGCYILHEDSDRTNDCYVVEIPPGRQLNPQRHLFEELVYVLSGRGATTVWNEGGVKQTLEWQAGSLFTIPLNAWHEHFNVAGDHPARLLGVTNAPAVINQFEDPEFVFHCDYVFSRRYAGEPGYFSAEARYREGNGQKLWETNFIPDVRQFELKTNQRRGAGGRGARFDMGKNTLGAHISEFPVGTYKKAHRHEAGAHVIIIRGHGYSLMWPEGESPQRYDWQEGSLIIPPENWFHQHFNTATTPSAYLALRYLDIDTRFRIRNLKPTLSSTSIKDGGDQIEYADEDPAIRTVYAQELAQSGLSLQMDAVYRSESTTAG